jgi:hypothetical protein
MPVHGARSHAAEAVGKAAQAEPAPEACFPAQFGGLQHDGAGDGAYAIAHGRGAFHHADFARGKGVDFRRVLGAPLLPFERNVVGDNGDPVRMQSLYDRFGNGSAGIQNRHAGQFFQGFAKIDALRRRQLFGRHRHCGLGGRSRHRFFRHDHFLQYITVVKVELEQGILRQSHNLRFVVAFEVADCHRIGSPFAEIWYDEVAVFVGNGATACLRYGYGSKGQRLTGIGLHYFAAQGYVAVLGN